MANKIIKYNLTNPYREGSKRNPANPFFIEEGGWFRKANSNDPPFNWDLIGVTVDGSSEEGLGAFANQAAIKTYLDTYINITDWTDAEGTEYAHSCNADAAAYIWSKK